MSWGRAMIVAFALVAVLIVAASFGSICPSCDAINIGNPALTLCAVALGIAILVSLANSRRPLAVGAMIGTLAVLWAIGPRSVAVAQSCSAEATPTLHVVEFNLWEDNSRPTEAAAWIRAHRPDVVLLAEAKLGAAPVVDTLAEFYPFRVGCLRRLPCSTIILSRIRPTAVMSLGHGDVENRRGLSAAAMILPVAGLQAAIVAVHLSRPWPAGRQRVELAELSASLATFDRASTVVGGDFNAVPTMRLVRDFAADNGMRRVDTGATWPSTVGHWATIPVLAIDHVLVGRRWSVMRASVGPAAGSDHRGLDVILCAEEDQY